jgi:hypothetical protein
MGSLKSYALSNLCIIMSCIMSKCTVHGTGSDAVLRMCLTAGFCLNLFSHYSKVITSMNKFNEIKTMTQLGRAITIVIISHWQNYWQALY